MPNRFDQNRIDTRSNDDRGIAAVWMAVVFLFFIGAAALAVDSSGAFNLAQTDQTTADLSCLAGVQEIPASATNGIDTAYLYASANWPTMAGLTGTVTGKTATYSDGAGNEIYIDAEYNSDPSQMYVRITEVGDNTFGKAIDQPTVTVRQEAACSGLDIWEGTGMVPIGALPGSWSGDLFDCAAKVTGNCGALRPDANGANAYRDAVANGIVGNFIYHHGNHNIPYNGYATIDCFASPCSVSGTEPGNMVGPWNQGLTTRFTATMATSNCLDAGWFQCDSLEDVLGEAPTPLGSAPVTKSFLGWNDSVFGTFQDAKDAVHSDAEHYYFNGTDLDCDNVRLATVPIVDNDIDWAPPQSASGWPNGKKDMKFIGFYTIYIREPILAADIGGPMDADIIWFGPNAMCDSGEMFQPFGAATPVDAGVKLIAP